MQLNYTAILIGATSGFVSAVQTDIQAFKSWKSFDEAKKYNWGVAAWRWFQGATLGALAGAGVGGALGTNS